MEETISRKIAKFAINLKYEDIPSNVIYEVKRFLYDSVGCALGGYHTKDVNIIHDIYKNIGGKPEATIIGFGDKIPAINASFVNSLMIRSLDFNDIYWKEDPSHPSDIIPAALSVGEMVNASMKDVIVAIVLAYEFEMRMCEFAVPGVRERKWHHATLTQFVSPVVAGKLLNLTEDEMVNAIGISASHNFTIGCPTAGKLTMMKNTVDPMAVQSGVLAAIMAKKGYTGTEEIFEGKEGLIDVLGPRWDTSKFLSNLGNPFKILECGMKAFPAEALTHTHITAALKIVIENDIKPVDIKEVTVTALAKAVDILFDKNKYKINSRETADHSLPYCIARAIIDRKITTQSFDEDKLTDPLLKDIIYKIKGEPSKEFEKIFPEKQPSQVVIVTKDNKKYKVYLEYPKGDPREPMTIEDIDNKFKALSSKLINESKQNKIKTTIFNCENMLVREFMSQLKL
ncbi:MAG: MmgE/PrpD family protein [Bacteroidales bacterium]|nr:MmgE/PrpD family protein [Bacteroidales bacterium]